MSRPRIGASVERCAAAGGSLLAGVWPRGRHLGFDMAGPRAAASDPVANRTDRRGCGSDGRYRRSARASLIVRSIYCVLCATDPSLAQVQRIATRVTHNISRIGVFVAFDDNRVIYRVENTNRENGVFAFDTKALKVTNSRD